MSDFNRAAKLLISTCFVYFQRTNTDAKIPQFPDYMYISSREKRVPGISPLRLAISGGDDQSAVPLRG